MHLRRDFTREQCQIFEERIRCSVNFGQRTIADITELVKRDLLALRTDWATAIAYDRVLWKRVYAGLKRIEDRGEISKGPMIGKLSTWVPKIVGVSADGMIVDDPVPA